MSKGIGPCISDGLNEVWYICEEVDVMFVGTVRVVNRIGDRLKLVHSKNLTFDLVRLCRM